MKKKENNFVYIDGSNLHKSIAALGWKLDYRVFRRWLEQKYHVDAVYLFIGLVPQNKDLYMRLQEYGYILVYKEITYDGDGKVKGNCDADLVLKVARDYYEGRLRRALLVSSDGDYSSLVAFLKEMGVFRALLSPSNHCSFLLRKLNIPIVYLHELRGKLAMRGQKEKAPGADESAQGSSS
ncbi:MAG: hypothetical protein A3C90_03415 [Candidatus Magasanikbacteria bacterium RIFCSPHIGHO2_02_FULL_51_14]|uniref:NYN domain-containing protein n=1 Tax=Candidatus Magasanikbacteria bacterium RIFCSPHIGHO2_02_FULL_51_14 TaxID=1798683 RepID=A0A1F6MR80_9BACT|nr:MAG: hypothetical protein A3C90_03415 [Candidatus Magasanikbacteria bacterium RIFCSPHIGHO2_02_FULL_51_14]